MFSPPPRYRLGLVVSAATVLLAYKCLTIAVVAQTPILLGWALESAVLLTLWAVTAWAERRLAAALLSSPAHSQPAVGQAGEDASEPAQPRSRVDKLLGGLLSGLFYALFNVLILVSIAHTFFFESAAERRISLLEVDLRTLGYFFTKVLPVRGLLLMVGLVVAIYLLALPLARLSRAMRPARVALALVGLWVLLGIALVLSPRVPSPLADIAADLAEQFTTTAVVVDRTRPARYTPGLLDKRGALLPAQTTRFDKVLVFVMETMTSAVMEQQKTVLPSSTFVHRALATSHVFNRYFASNQDSRTGMLSMLGSRFIPFEAYTEAGRDHYMKLGQKSSLVDQFDKLGYRTAFAVSQQEIELVVGDLPWHEKIHLEEGDVSRLESQYLCFVPYEFEHSCEDRALLPRVLDFIDQNERVFLYQEFIWGHASEYNKASGRTNTEYYSAYLDAVVEHLQKTGQLERTLIVLTSDHGFRDKGLQNDLAVYQIPLLFHAAGFSAQADARLFSHLDFKDLLMHELLPAAPAPPESSFVLVIGPTGTSFLTVLTQPGQMLLMKAREDERFLVHAAGYANAAESQRSAGDFLRLFDDYVSYFGKL